jgi:hypothetical protein
MNSLLRTSKVLKYLALVIFCMEFLTPVFLFASPQASSDEISRTHVQAHHQASLSLASLFAEENTNEGEREGSRSKDQLVSYDLHFSFSFSGRHVCASSAIPFFTQNELHRVMFPLYQLHCLLLI